MNLQPPKTWVIDTKEARNYTDPPYLLFVRLKLIAVVTYCAILNLLPISCSISVLSSRDRSAGSVTLFCGINSSKCC